MDTKGFIRINAQEYLTTIHYIKFENKFYGLTHKDSCKIEKIKNNSQIMVANGMKSEEFFPCQAVIQTDEELVKHIFDTMLDLEFTHFKEWDDDIVSIEFIPTII